MAFLLGIFFEFDARRSAAYPDGLPCGCCVTDGTIQPLGVVLRPGSGLGRRNLHHSGPVLRYQSASSSLTTISIAVMTWSLMGSFPRNYRGCTKFVIVVATTFISFGLYEVICYIPYLRDCSEMSRTEAAQYHPPAGTY
jgi:hypothetical protein